MKKIIDLRTWEADVEHIRELSYRMFRWQLNKHVSGNNKKQLLQDFRTVVSLHRFGSTGGMSYSSRRRRWYVRNSCNLGRFKHDAWCKTPFYYNEYAHIREDKQMGAFYCAHPDDIVKGTIAHEIAHVVHYVFQNTGDKLPKAKVPEHDRDAHGLTWQGLYRELRGKYVNNSSTILYRGAPALRKNATMTPAEHLDYLRSPP